MIGFLKGQVIDRTGGSLLVDVGGVGYKIQISNIKYQNGDEVAFYVHTYVREDEISLYGFEDKKALVMFELLISVSGVGPKVAMVILSSAKVEKIQEAVARADVSFFTAMKGLGKKGAQKIIIELKNKLGSVEELDLGDEGEDNEVVAGLVAMGYDSRKVRQVVEELAADLSESEIIKAVIKKLGK